MQIFLKCINANVLHIITNHTSVICIFNNINFGLWHGGKLSGTVFKDAGTGGGTANNGVRDGGETGLPGVTVRLTNSTGTTTHDTAVTDGAGSYTLWIANALCTPETMP